MMSDGSRLLELMLKVSEKAANIARACRQKKHLFELLVQEKCSEEKNARFVQDFKTLADVLIQETIRYDIGNEFPVLAKYVRGEENNTFTNTLGEKVTVKVCPSYDDTAKLLEKVLNNDSEAARLLALEVHREIRIDEVPGVESIPMDLPISIDDLAVWIDPIDSTAEYIHGIETVDESTGLHLSGLRCVTVLIGAFLRSTGKPVLGVINQPFYANNDSTWKGISYWGYASDDMKLSSMECVKTNKKIIILSSSESQDIKSKLSENGFILIETAGAGYKLLMVILGLADAYILSKGSTFKWDTCAPQAILASLKGGIVTFRDFCKTDYTCENNLHYLTGDGDFCNRNGLIAYRNSQILESLKVILSSEIINDV